MWSGTSDAHSHAFSSITGGTFYHGPISEDDIRSSALFQPTPLFGRTKEVKQLLESFQTLLAARNVSQTTCQHQRLVIVHGVSGMGKTSLVESALREVVCDNQGYFCTGKFAQKGSTHDAYSALMAAFSELCDLVVQSSDFEQRKDHIRKVLGADGYILANQISNIQHLFPRNDCADKDGSSNLPYDYALDNSSLARFQLACKSFLHAISSDAHPVVIFIDDIQWADEGSRQLISTLVEDEKFRNLLFVLTYRDEEAESAISILPQTTKGYVDIHLRSLDLPDIQELIGHIMDLDSSQTSALDEVKQLSQLVQSRTKGNPFHVCQYFTFIQQEGLLIYCEQNGGWEFDIQQLQEKTMVANSLVEILQRRIDRLLAPVFKVLMVAALLGFNFDERVVMDVILKQKQQPLDSDEEEPDVMTAVDVKTALNSAVTEGFVEKSTTKEFCYMFSHDKLLSSFLDRAQGQGESPERHLLIAQSFVGLTTVEHQYSYQAAQHANYASELYESHHGLTALVKLNLEAADYCMKRSGFFTAADHIRKGDYLLDRDGRKWEQYYDLSLEVNEKMTEVELILGNFTACDDLVNEILLHNTSEKTKLKAGWSQILAKLGRNDNVGALEAGRMSLLHNLGVYFPNKVNVLHIARKFFRVRRLLSQMSDHDILGLPMLDSFHKISMQQLFVHMAVTSLMEDNENQGMYAALLVVEHSLLEGLSEFSATGFAMYALAEALIEKKERAYRYGQLALTVSRRMRRSEMEIATISLLSVGVLHWKEPVGNLGNPLFQAFMQYFPGQNLWFGALAACCSLTSALASGENLIVLKERADRMFLTFKQYKHDELASWILSIYQCILNLTSIFDDWTDVAILTGDLMNEDDYMNIYSEQHCGTAMLLKLLLAYQFGQYDLAECMIRKLTSIAKILRLHYHFSIHHFYAGMTYLALYQKTRNTKYWWRAGGHKKKLLKLRAIQCPNSEPLLQVLLAEEASLLPSTTKNLAKYEVAVEKAAEVCKEAGLVQYEGLVYERAGFLLARNGDVAKASDYFSEAMSLYANEWGCCAKHEWLNEQSSAALRQPKEVVRIWGKHIEIAQPPAETGNDDNNIGSARTDEN